MLDTWPQHLHTHYQQYLHVDFKKVHRFWWVANNLHEYFKNEPLYVVAVKLRVQQELPDLVEKREAVKGKMWVDMKNGGCDSCHFSSVDGVCNAHTIWFNKAGSRGSRVVCACTCHLFSLVNLAAAICMLILWLYEVEPENVYVLLNLTLSYTLTRVKTGELASKMFSKCARHVLCSQMYAFPSKILGFTLILHTGVAERNKKFEWI